MDLNENWRTDNFYNNKSELQRFYDNTNVFLTGGTGFLGKLLIEKLLRCTEVSTIYMLIREKRGKTTQERLDRYFNDVVFDRLKSVKSKFKNKIIPVQGDCTLAGLGLSLNDRNMLINNINIVFHVAATVNFDEKLRLAYSINVKGTESVLNLSKQAENLKSFIYVSTAYSNCHLSKIDETFYDVINYKDVELLLEKIDDEQVQLCTEKILGKWPNTYTFTKALAESLIRDQGNGISVGIFRPAIVTSTYKEPLKGWVDNLYGPTGACTGAASGVLRVMQCVQENSANIVPADLCVSALIASAWDTNQINSAKTHLNIPIYNYVSVVDNPITWEEYYTINKMYGEIYPLSNALWCIKFMLTSNRSVYNLMKVLYHYIPGVSLDFLGLFLGKKPSFCKLYNKVHKFSDVVTYFAISDLKFTNNNVNKLWGKLSEEDQKVFSFNIANLNWIDYLKTYILGIRLYLLKDPIETIPQARQRQTILKLLHVLMKMTFWVFSINFLSNFLINSVKKGLIN
ncbi:fatty acyl-CoA reductase wat-like [Onthophagus taurus]|uniref:fatty acyl-CoA reductase wat-like n=1 Tax=Onthophagus taurus TaxID=166361 RepID=UPI000C201D42|nr:fatty acyl-CoA reductase wat-like [Onthophagus taurus]